jgi:hypothetical protein
VSDEELPLDLRLLRALVGDEIAIAEPAFDRRRLDGLTADRARLRIVAHVASVAALSPILALCSSSCPDIGQPFGLCNSYHGASTVQGRPGRRAKPASANGTVALRLHHQSAKE